MRTLRDMIHSLFVTRHDPNDLPFPRHRQRRRDAIRALIHEVRGKFQRPKHAFLDEETNVEARVWDLGERGFSVTLCDLDSGETIPSKIYPRAREREAVEYAKSIAEPFCACGRRVGSCDRSRKGCKKP